MKRVLIFVFAFLSFLFAYADKLVYIELAVPEDGDFFYDVNHLELNYVCDKFILATLQDSLNFDYKVVDSKAWDNHSEYILLWLDSENLFNRNGSIISKDIVFVQEYFMIIKVAKNIPYEYEKLKHKGIIRIPRVKIHRPQSNLHHAPAQVIDEDNYVKYLVSAINRDSLMKHVQHLQDYGTRKYNTKKCVEAQNWIKSHYERYGYETQLQDVSNYISKNVIAIKKGIKYPDEYVVCGAHFDTILSGDGGEESAPGADDNGTGTAGMLEIARVLSGRSFDRSIVICSFTAEEIGLIGSRVFADKCKEEGMNILGYFNIDMSGYLPEGSPMCTSVIFPTAATDLFNFYKAVSEIYVPELLVERGTYTKGDSDHTSFNRAGYMGIHPFENLDTSCPYIHSTNDVIGVAVNNFDQVLAFTRACVANVITLADKFDKDFVDFTLSATLHAVHLSWNQFSEDVSHCVLFRDHEQLAVIQAPAKEYIDQEVVSNHTYTYFVKAVYKDGRESLASNILTAYTVNPGDVPFVESWDSNYLILPVWTQEKIKGETNWEISSLRPPYSEPNAISLFTTDSPTITRLIMPSLDLGKSSTAGVSFRHSQFQSSETDTTTLKVSFKNERTKKWIQLDQFVGSTDSWVLRSITLPDLSDNYTVSFIGQVGNRSEISLDDIKVFDNRIKWIDGVMVYPNPSMSYVTIESNGIIYSVQLYNQVGQLVSSTDYGERNVRLPVNRLLRGLYLISVKTDEGTFVRKIVVGDM